MIKLFSKKIAWILILGLSTVIIIVAVTWYKTLGRVQIQFDIHQNQELIYLSAYAEPPQFAIWLENTKNKKCETVFVTSRVSKGDWEGKADVPVALPRWYQLFKINKQKEDNTVNDDQSLAVTGATPKEDYFSVRVDVPPGSQWICWIEMNLAGDFNDAFPEFDRETLTEDEFSCGQPALLFKAELTADEGVVAIPEITAQSIWEEGNYRIEPVSEGITTAKNVFDKMKISVIKPKMKIIQDKVESQPN
jgi:hypothetical protein